MSFDNPDDVDVQRETIPVPGATASANAAITPVDPGSTLVLATLSSAGAAPVGDGSVRVQEGAILRRGPLTFRFQVRGDATTGFLLDAGRVKNLRFVRR